MTIQQYWTVELDQDNVVFDKRWVIIPSMLNDFGRVADLFCAVGVKTVPVSRADAIVGDVQFVTYTVRSREDPIWPDKRSATKELGIAISALQVNLPGPRSLWCICTPDNTALRNRRSATLYWK